MVSVHSEACWRCCSLYGRNRISSASLQYTYWGFDCWLL